METCRCKECNVLIPLRLLFLEEIQQVPGDLLHVQSILSSCRFIADVVVVLLHHLDHLRAAVTSLPCRGLAYLLDPSVALVEQHADSFLDAGKIFGEQES